MLANIYAPNPFWMKSLPGLACWLVLQKVATLSWREREPKAKADLRNARNQLGVRALDGHYPGHPLPQPAEPRRLLAPNLPSSLRKPAPQRVKIKLVRKLQ